MPTFPPHCEARSRGLLRSSARCGLLVVAAILTLLVRPAFVAAQATCSSTAAISCGEIKSGGIGALSETDCYTFTGEAGEVVQLLSKAVGSTIQACAQLRDSAGNIVNVGSCNAATTITLPASDTYTIRLYDQSNNQTGNYNVQMQVLSATASSCPVLTLPCGAQSGGRVLSSIVQSDTYRFVTSAANEVVSITTSDVATGFDACWQLYAADGTAIGAQKCGQAVRTLPLAGAYTIRAFELSNDATGGYRMDVTTVSATATSCPDATLTLCQKQSSSIATLGDNDTYWFTTTATGQVIDIATTTTSGTMTTCWEMFNADGSSTGSLIVCGADQRVIATPGTYVLRVFDQTYTGVGTYDLLVGPPGLSLIHI